MTIIHSPVLLVERNPKKCSSTANVANNILVISNPTYTFEISIDEQVVAFMFEGKYAPKVPTCSVNDMLRNTVKHVIQAEGARQVVINAVLDKVWTSDKYDLHHIRNLYLISNTLGTHNSMAVHGEWGILKKIPVSADYYKLVYDQTVLGIDYLDCSNQKLSLIDFNLKDHSEKTRQFAWIPCKLLYMFVKVADE